MTEEKVENKIPSKSITKVLNWLQTYPDLADFSNLVDFVKTNKEQENFESVKYIIHRINKLSDILLTLMQTFSVNGTGEYFHTFFTSEIQNKDFLKKIKSDFVKEKTEFVYIMKQTNEKNLYKIGRTKDLAKRLAQLVTGNCFLEIVASKEVENAVFFEKFLHEHYKHKQLKDEWFLLNQEDLLDIRLNFNFTWYTGEKCDE